MGEHSQVKPACCSAAQVSTAPRPWLFPVSAALGVEGGSGVCVGEGGVVFSEAGVPQSLLSPSRFC